MAQRRRRRSRQSVEKPQKAEKTEPASPASPAAGETWYIRTGTKTQGPFSRTALEKYASQARLKPHMQVSRDQIAWASPSDYGFTVAPGRSGPDVAPGDSGDEIPASKHGHAATRPSRDSRPSGVSRTRNARSQSGAPAGLIIGGVIVLLIVIGAFVGGNGDSGEGGDDPASSSPTKQRSAQASGLHAPLVKAIDQAKADLGRLNTADLAALDRLTRLQAAMDQFLTIKRELSQIQRRVAQATRHEKDRQKQLVLRQTEQLLRHVEYGLTANYNDFKRLPGPVRSNDWGRHKKDALAGIARVKQIRSKLSESWIQQLGLGRVLQIAEQLEQEIKSVEDLVLPRLEAYVAAVAKAKSTIAKGEKLEGSVNDLTLVYGFTHIINGTDHYIDNKIVRIPAKFRDIYINAKLGPNKVFVRGWFKFRGNTTGKNKLGMDINVELYEVDATYAAAQSAVAKTLANNKEFLDLLDAAHKALRDSNETAKWISKTKGAMRSLLVACGATDPPSDPTPNPTQKRPTPTAGATDAAKDFSKLLARADALEKEGKLTEAAQALESALRIKIDPSVSRRLDSVRKLIAEKQRQARLAAERKRIEGEYKSAVASCKRAIAASEYGPAKIAYLRARQIKPSGSELDDLGSQMAKMPIPAGEFIPLVGKGGTFLHRDRLAFVSPDGEVQILGDYVRYRLKYQGAVREFSLEEYQSSSDHRRGQLLGVFDPGGGMKRGVYWTHDIFARSRGESKPFLDRPVHIVNGVFSEQGIPYKIRSGRPFQLASRRQMPALRWQSMHGSPTYQVYINSKREFACCMLGGGAREVFVHIFDKRLKWLGKYNLKLEPNRDIAKAVGVDDLNGDGLDEIIFIGENRRLSILTKGRSMKSPIVKEIATLGETWKLGAIVALDLNGDGSKELLVHCADSKNRGFLVFSGQLKK